MASYAVNAAGIDRINFDEPEPLEYSFLVFFLSPADVGWGNTAIAWIVLLLAILGIFLGLKRKAPAVATPQDTTELEALRRDLKNAELSKQKVQELQDQVFQLEERQKAVASELAQTVEERAGLLETVRNFQHWLGSHFPQHDTLEQISTLEDAEKYAQQFELSLAAIAKEQRVLRADSEVMKGRVESYQIERDGLYSTARDHLSLGEAVDVLSARLEDEKDFDAEATRQYLSGLLLTMKQNLGKDFERIAWPSIVPEEVKRIKQYSAILGSYNEQIAALREQDLDDDDKEESIFALKRLRDTEIEELSRASDD